MARKKKNRRPVAAAPTPDTVRLPAAPDPEQSAEAPRRDWSEADGRFWNVMLVLLLGGIALRQWRLQDFPFHPDEAIHAWFSNGFDTYTYDPTYHGPVLYHLVRMVYSVLGVNDFTARLVPSLLGVALLALVAGPLRTWIGTRATLWSLALLNLSPVIVTYSRRLLHDSLVMFLTLGATLCFATALRHPAHTTAGREARVGLVVLLTLFLATKANVFFILAMLVAFWLAIFIQQWLRRTRRPGIPYQWWLPPAVLVVSCLLSVMAVRPPEVVKGFKIPEFFYVIMCLWMLALVWSNMATAPLSQAVPEPAASADDEPALARTAAWRTWLMAATAGVLVFSFFFGHGYLWWQAPLKLVRDPAGWAQALLHSWSEVWSVMTWQSPVPRLQVAEDWAAITDAVPRMLDYWGGQQAKPRLPSRHDYYLPLMMVYELPLVLVGLAGFVAACRRRSFFTDLLVWWSLTSLIVYSVANEKVPWLLTHIMLPFILLAGWWLGQLQLTTRWQRGLLWAGALVGAIYLGRGVYACNWQRAVDNHEPMFFAQTTEAFRDAFFNGLEATQGRQGAIWLHGEKQWPGAWYMREDFPLTAGSPPQYDRMLQPGPVRLMVHLSPGDWQAEIARGKADRFDYERFRRNYAHWQHKEVEFYVWPRISWPALRPGVWSRFWWNRQVMPGNGMLDAPGEWSSSPAVVSTPPREGEASPLPRSRQ